MLQLAIVKVYCNKICIIMIDRGCRLYYARFECRTELASTPQEPMRYDYYSKSKQLQGLAHSK